LERSAGVEVEARSSGEVVLRFYDGRGESVVARGDHAVALVSSALLAAGLVPEDAFLRVLRQVGFTIE